MTQQATGPDVVDLFKKVYGAVHDLMPSDFPLAQDIPWSTGQRVGDEFIEAVVLGNEVGITLGGNGTDIFEINPAIAGAVKQAKVKPYVTVLPSIIPWAVISRSQGGEQSFFNGTKHLTKNNIRSHGKFHEIFRWYGQASGGLGYVSYATATYRTVSFTNGGGTLISSVYGSSAFVAGVKAANKLILMAPGSFAAGHWVGMKNVRVNQVATADDSIVASGSLVSFDANLGILQVDFAPVAATSTTSHKIVFAGMEDFQEMIGIQKILSTVGTLFEINNSTYELFRGNVKACGAKKLTLTVINSAVADAVNQGELEGDLTLYINPRTWSTISSDEAALRKYDAEYDANEATNGFKNIVYYSQNGKITIKAHSCVKEGEAFGLMLETWSRSGSAEISFKVPGAPQEVIFPLQNQSGWAYRSFSDQYIFCYRPSWNILFTGINDESAT